MMILKNIIKMIIIIDKAITILVEKLLMLDLKKTRYILVLNVLILLITKLIIIIN